MRTKDLNVCEYLHKYNRPLIHPSEIGNWHLINTNLSRPQREDSKSFLTHILHVWSLFKTLNTKSAENYLNTINRLNFPSEQPQAPG